MLCTILPLTSNVKPEEGRLEDGYIIVALRPVARIGDTFRDRVAVPTPEQSKPDLAVNMQGFRCLMQPGARDMDRHRPPT